MKRTDRNVSKALRDVWEWKEAVYRDVKHLPVEEALAAILDQAQESSVTVKSHRHHDRRRKFTPAGT
jgi:hypothetical protein